MLIKSPMKKEQVRPNKRKNKAGSNKKTNSSSNGHSYGKRVKSQKKTKNRLTLPKVEPWKIIVGAIVLGVLGLIYLNHVFATQKLLREVQQMERKFNQARRMHNDYKLTYDRMIGPTEIYEKAKQRGFINGGPAEKVIEVEE